MLGAMPAAGICQCNAPWTAMFYPIYASRHKKIELTLFVLALAVMHPMLSDRQTNVVPNTDVAHNGVYQQIAKTSRREHTGCCG